MDNSAMRSVSTKQLSIANTARKYPYEALTVLHPNLDLHWLWEASLRVRKNAATGIDNQSYADYEEGKQEGLKGGGTVLVWATRSRRYAIYRVV